MNDRGKPRYMIGVVAEMLAVHPQTLRFYEKKGLVRPSRTVGRTRMYSQEDVDELARLLRLTRDLGVNLAPRGARAGGLRTARARRPLLSRASGRKGEP